MAILQYILPRPTCQNSDTCDIIQLQPGSSMQSSLGPVKRIRNHDHETELTSKHDYLNFSLTFRL